MSNGAYFFYGAILNSQQLEHIKQSGVLKTYPNLTLFSPPEDEGIAYYEKGGGPQSFLLCKASKQHVYGGGKVIGIDNCSCEPEYEIEKAISDLNLPTSLKRGYILCHCDTFSE